MLQNYNTWIVASVFFNEPTKRHYLIEVSKKAGLAHTSTKLIINSMIKKEIIKEIKEERGKRIFPVYITNINNQGYRKYKKMYNLFSIIESGIIEYLKDKLMPKSIILFGSYVRGEDTEESDIDIFLECNKKEINLVNFENKLCRKIETHFKSNFKDYPKELKNNIVNGVVLSGYLEVFDENKNREG